jgi:nicotinamide-nucleotide amidase
MPDPAELDEESARYAAEVSEAARRSGRTVAVAESLTSGAIASHLGAAESASDWFAGGVVAYSSEVKFTVLGVDRGPVVTSSCALQMAAGVARLTGAGFAVSVTGVGGPDPEEERPPGTVYIAVHTPEGETVEEHLFPGDDPQQILRETIRSALHVLAGRARAFLLAQDSAAQDSAAQDSAESPTVSTG